MGPSTGRKMPVLTAYFPMVAYGILRKGGLFMESSLEDCHTGLPGSSTQAETGCTDLQLSVAVWSIARYCPDLNYICRLPPGTKPGSLDGIVQHATLMLATKTSFS